MNARTLALSFSLALAGPASAQLTPWYAGLSAGMSRTSADLVANRESTITGGLLDAQTAFDDDDRAFKATLGYRILPWLAAEVDYTDLGEHHLASRLFGGNPPAPAELALTRRIRGFGADAVFTWPVAPRWQVMGRLGAYHSRLDARQALAGNIVFTNGDPSERSRSVSRSETVLRYGAGVQRAINDCSWVRLEWTRHDDIGKAFQVGGSGTTGEAATDSVVLGYYYRF